MVDRVQTSEINKVQNMNGLVQRAYKSILFKVTKIEQSLFRLSEEVVE